MTTDGACLPRDPAVARLGGSEISPVEEIIAEARADRMVILIDDEDRENEGDLVIPAACADERAIAFMARQGCGLICLALTEERVDALGLPLMHAFNGTRHETAFTISIEAREGVTTGISAADRARTIATAIGADVRRDDLVSPGHVFPLRARSGGVLMRAGHTEASVDLARLAGHGPAGVICEIMNPDGTMARLPDLTSFGAQHGLKIGTIADLIAYRRRTEHLIRPVITRTIRDLPGGDWQAHVFADVIHGSEHLALTFGAGDRSPMPVWIHVDDIRDHLEPARGMRAAMERIAEIGAGVVVLIREQAHASLAHQVSRLAEEVETGGELRDFGIGAQILRHLGLTDFTLLHNTVPNMPALGGHAIHAYGIEGAGR